MQGRAKSSGPFWPTFQTLRAQAKRVIVRNGFCVRNLYVQVCPCVVFFHRGQFGTQPFWSRASTELCPPTSSPRAHEGVQGRAKSSGPFWPTFQTLRAQAKRVIVRNGFCVRNHKDFPYPKGSPLSQGFLFSKGYLQP